MFGTNNPYIQDDGCGHEITCALRPVNSGENTAPSTPTSRGMTREHSCLTSWVLAHTVDRLMSYWHILFWVSCRISYWEGEMLICAMGACVHQCTH